VNDFSRKTPNSLQPFHPHFWLGSVALILLLLLAFGVPVASGKPLRQAEATIHTVRPGETLSEIAAAYGVSTEELLAINGITNANQIYEGQELLLPENAIVIGEPTLDIPTHTVQSGETLSQIAEIYGVSLARLMYLNGVRDPDAVYEGQELRLPAEANLGDQETPEATATPAEENDEEASEPTTEGEADATSTRTPTATTTPTSTPTVELPETHTVRRGETLSQIAELYDLDMDELMAFNGIVNADAIVIGQDLLLEAPPPTATPTAEPTETPAEEGSATAAPVATEITQRTGNPIASLNQTYTVEADDTINRIALRLGVDAEAFRRINKLGDDYDLIIGDELIVPATSGELRVTSTTPEEVYVVQPGDSLGRIAEQYELSMGSLMAANYLSNPDSIYVGQQLIIPEPEAEEADTGEVQSKTPQTPQVGPARSGFFYYNVRVGDTVQGVAEQFNSTRLAILDYNSLPNAETLYSGIEIRIPYGPPDLPVRMPPVPTSGTRFLVSLSRQECWLFWGKEVVREWICSTGYGEYTTRTGNFAVKSKIANAKSNAYALDMPYWLGIYNVGHYENGIHGLPVSWKTGKKIWEGMIGEPATYGCAMLADPQAEELFDIAYLGMPVHVVN